ncbi:MAG: class D sortase [bacterium]|nr:class D sortase [bacterium]
MWNDWQRGAGGRVESIASKSEPAVWLSVPGVGLNTLVLNGADKESLYRYPCLESNIGMNESGMKLILGHRDMHFRKLKDIAIGFKIGLELPGNKQRAYRVVETEIVAAGKVLQRVNRMTDEDWLVLMTCYPFEYTGPAPRRFLVWARPVEKIKSASGGPPGGQNLFEKRFQHLQKLLLVGQFTNCFDTSLRRAHLQSKGNK